LSLPLDLAQNLTSPKHQKQLQQCFFYFAGQTTLEK